jgi:NAD(P)-dependent dehydrogenase (short-subunit alcohol dehydrogenase family)
MRPTKGIVNMSKLAGRVAVVTGASQGIGAGIAKALAAEGAAVVVNYLKNKQAAASVVEAITQAGGKAIAFGADVAEVAGAEGIIETPIGVRISQGNVNDYHHKWADAERDAEIIFGSLADAGADFIHTCDRI